MRDCRAARATIGAAVPTCPVKASLRCLAWVYRRSPRRFAFQGRAFLTRVMTEKKKTPRLAICFAIALIAFIVIPILVSPFGKTQADYEEESKQRTREAIKAREEREAKEAAERGAR